MKKDYTDIHVIADGSGSMRYLIDDMIGSFNTLIETQKAAPGEATVSFYKFDDLYEPLYQWVPLTEIKELTNKDYFARGMTALYDAIGKTIMAMGVKYAAMAEEDRPESVMLLILTDGQENSSKEYTQKMIKEMIELQTGTYKWVINFLGTNQDAVLTARSMGISLDNAMTYTNNSEGLKSAITTMSDKYTMYRSCVGPKDATLLNFTAADAQVQEDAKNSSI